MTITNKITTLRSPNQLIESEIQGHLDTQNADGWELIAVDNLVGWYRFFWKKSVE